jgi:hypothetical protein
MRGPCSTKIYSERYLECQSRLTLVTVWHLRPRGVGNRLAKARRGLGPRLIGRAKVNTSPPDWELASNPKQHARSMIFSV